MSHVKTPIFVDLNNHPEWTDDDFRSDHACHAELSRRARAGNQDAVLTLVQIVLRHSGLPRQISRFDDPEDIVAEIIVALVALATRWDPSRGVPWRAYAKQRVWWVYHGAAKKRYAARNRSPKTTTIDYSGDDAGEYGSYEWAADGAIDAGRVVDRLVAELGADYVARLINSYRVSWRHEAVSAAVSEWIAAGSPGDTPIIDPDSRVAIDAIG